MAIYWKDGTEAISAYSVGGGDLDSAYDVNGDLIFTKYDPPSPDPYIEGRTIVFEDNFNFFNAQKWVKEVGIVRNYDTELQCYREENVGIEDSCLVLTAKRESYGGKNWTSGSISGQTIQAITYGRFEAKIKFPNVVGAFGAFWLVGSNFWKEYVDGGRPTNHGEIWPKCGEIDVTETIPGNSNVAQANMWTYTGSSMGGGRSGTIDSSQWHIYAIEWTENYVAALVDGVEYKRWTFSDYSASAVQAYHLPFYMILNLAVGAAGGTPDASTTEMKMFVDWVRVYAPL